MEPPGASQQHPNANANASSNVRANLRPTLSNQFVLLRNSGSLSQDDAALVECLGREEEDHRHMEIQKALKRHNVEFFGTGRIRRAIFDNDDYVPWYRYRGMSIVFVVCE